MNETTGPSADYILGWVHLFELAAKEAQPTPGHVFVLLPVEDCELLARVLLDDSIRRREVQDA